MNPRERMQTVLGHERPDRTPTVWGGRPEAARAIMQYFGVETLREALDALGVDPRGAVGVAVSFPDFDRQANGTLEGDFPYAGQPVILHDERTFEDAWGVIRRVGSDRKYVEWVSGPLVEAGDPGECDFPGPERVIDDPDIARRVEAQKKDGLWVRGGITHPFKRAWELRGLEELLVDYIANVDFLEVLYDRIYLLFGEIARRLTAAGVDQLGVTGDIAMQDRVFVGEQRWRAIDKPRMARLIAGCKAINPDLHVFMHSDGYLWPIMDDLIEIGFDIIDPIQPECMDPVEVKRRYGDRITLHGCGSLQKTLPFGTPEDCRNEVRHLIRHCGYNGGLVLRVSNAIGYDVPVENIAAWFGEARDFDLSAL